jgi:hypothetical protein
MVVNADSGAVGKAGLLLSRADMERLARRKALDCAAEARKKHGTSSQKGCSRSRAGGEDRGR